jgi:phosphatidylglycerophosphate synthase
MNYKIDKDCICCNAANIVTSIGILLCFAIQIVIYSHPNWLTGLFFLGLGVVASDFIDGRVARYFEKKGYGGSISYVGKFLDRFRDKNFQFTMLFFFVWHPKVEYHLKCAFSLLIICEVILLATLFIGAKRKADVAATDWGKWKMFLECVAILACMLNLLAQQHGIRILSGSAYVLTIVALISFGFAVMSIKGHLAPLLPK